MRALVWHGGRSMDVEDAPSAQPEAEQVVLEVEYAGICGSDLHAFRGHHGPRRPPLVLGHEVIGRIGGSDQRYVAFPLVTCGACPACRRGEENLCSTRGLLGLDRPGAFAEQVAVLRRSLTAVPDGLPSAVAVLTEALATPVSAVRIEGIGPGDRVLVLGGGPIGLLSALAATAAGADVSLSEPLAARRQLAEHLGARASAESAEELGSDFDVCLDTVAVPATLTQAVAAVRNGGRVAVVGLSSATAELPVGDMVRRGVALRGHYAYTRTDFDAALALLGRSTIPASFSETAPLDDGAEAFAQLTDDPGHHVKILLAP